MKNTQIKIILAAAAIATSACTRTLPDLMVDASSQAISINPVAAVTKAGPIDGTVFPNSYNMVVSAYYNAAEGASGNYFSGITFSRNASTGRWDESKYWPMSGTLNLLAYSANDGTSNVVSAAPVYQAKNTDGVTLTVTDNRTAQVDILHSQVEEKVWEATGVPMQFKHAQAAIAFVAKSNVAYNATRNEGITITKITLNNAKYSGTLAISKTEAAGTAPENGYCVWTALGSQAAKDLPGVGAGYNVPAAYLDVTSTGNHFGIGGTGIMVPEQAQTGFTIEYTMHNGFEANGTTKNDITGMKYTHTCSDNWIEGKKYIYELNFTLNKIEITPIVIDWNLEETEVEIPPIVEVEKEYLTLTSSNPNAKFIACYNANPVSLQISNDGVNWRSYTNMTEIQYFEDGSEDPTSYMVDFPVYIRYDNEFEMEDRSSIYASITYNPGNTPCIEYQNIKVEGKLKYILPPSYYEDLQNQIGHDDGMGGGVLTGFDIDGYDPEVKTTFEVNRSLTLYVNQNYE